MIRSNLIIGLALVALAGGAAAQSKNQTREEPREAQPSEMWRLAGQVILNGIERAGDYLIAVGGRGVVLRSEDGTYWHQVGIPTRTMLTRVVFYNERIGWAVGWDGAILRTTDGGKSWKLVNWEPKWGDPYFDILPTGPKSATVVGSRGRMLRTSDGGKTWTRVRGKLFKVGYHFFDIQPIGDSGIILAGERGMIARSLDGGETWKMVKPPYPGSYFGALPIGEWGVVLYGLEGEVYYAPDIRKLATLKKPLSYSPFTAHQITDPEKLARMGWIHIDNPSPESIFGARVLEGDHVIFVGVEGNVVHGQIKKNNLHFANASPTPAPLSDLIRLEDKWVLTGRNGLYYMPLLH